jgi:hypothetical protein
MLGEYNADQNKSRRAADIMSRASRVFTSFPIYKYETGSKSKVKLKMLIVFLYLMVGYVTFELQL